jgi:predicted lipoprotein with Yx(FWY)xxD motif
MTKAGLYSIIGGVALAMLVAGCGSTSTSNSPGASTTSPGGYNYPTPTSTTGGGGNTSGDVPIGTATVSVSGSQKTVLTTASGLTIYYRTSDSGTNVYMGADWPPVLAGSGTPNSSSSLPGTLAVLNDGNGAQVTYNGHPLYTFAGDAKAGDAHGQGLEGIWFVVTPDIAKASNSGSGTGPTPTPGSGYGYGG